MIKGVLLFGTFTLLLAAMQPVWCQAPATPAAPPSPAAQPSASEQAVTFPDLLQGKLCPLMLKVGELNAQWRQITVMMKQSGQGSPIDPSATNEDQQQDRALQIVLALQRALSPTMADYFTRGQTFAVGEETFLIAYQLPRTTYDVQSFTFVAQNPPQPVTEGTLLQLSLLNLHAIDGLANIRPFDMRSINELNLAAYNQFCISQLKTLRLTSSNNLRQLAASLQMYAQDHDEQFPIIDTWTESINVEPSIMTSPISLAQYVYNPHLSGAAIGNIPDPTVVPLVWDPIPDLEGKRLVAYVDGHIGEVKEHEWQELLKNNNIRGPVGPPAGGTHAGGMRQ